MSQNLFACFPVKEKKMDLKTMKRYATMSAVDFGVDATCVTSSISLIRNGKLLDASLRRALMAAVIIHTSSFTLEGEGGRLPFDRKACNVSENQFYGESAVGRLRVTYSNERKTARSG